MQGDRAVASGSYRAKPPLGRLPALATGSNFRLDAILSKSSIKVLRFCIEANFISIYHIDVFNLICVSYIK